MNLFEPPLTFALNHLLRAESWARAKLAPFAGETLEFRAALLPPLRLRIDAEGLLAAASAEAEPSLVVTIGPGALAAAARGEEHLLREIDVSGNARLAAEVMFLVRHLRWDAEEDAARIFGDAVAHRLAGAACTAAAWHADAARRLAEGLVEYAVEERGILATRADVAALAGSLARLRDGLERLEKRLDGLKR